MLAWPATGEATDYAFTKIAETKIIRDIPGMPGGPGTFVRFGVPSIDGHKVAFHGITSNMGYKAIFKHDGSSLGVVASNLTPIPSGRGDFFSIPPHVSTGGGNVAFHGYDSSFWQGIYTDDGGRLEMVADGDSAIPGGTGNFHVFSSPSIDGDTVAFIGYSESALQQGIYIAADAGFPLWFKTKVADLNTPIPDGSGNFWQFGAPSLDGYDVVFRGIGGTVPGLIPPTGSMWDGIYIKRSGSTLKKVVDRNNSIPGGSGTFTEFGDPSLDGRSLAFRGKGDFGHEGIFVVAETHLGMFMYTIADRNTPIPDGTGTFVRFSNPAKDGGSVAFWGISSDGLQQGIYIKRSGGSLEKVIAAGDEIDGKTVISLVGFGREGLSGISLAFRVAFDDGSSAIYLATEIPTFRSSNVGYYFNQKSYTKYIDDYTTGSCVGKKVATVTLGEDKNALSVAAKFAFGDVDLSVEEPSGECGWYENESTIDGGAHSGDVTSGGIEEYKITDGPAGTYTVRVHQHQGDLQEVKFNISVTNGKMDAEKLEWDLTESPRGFIFPEKK
jgi:hypothetical protein